MLRNSGLFFLAFSWLNIYPHEVSAQQLDEARYDEGTPALTQLWVSPSSGNDDNSGTSQSSPLQTVSAAWGKIPTGTNLSTGYQINLLPGTYSADNTPNYWESKHGTHSAPIILTSVQGRDSVTFLGGPNIFDVKYLYLKSFKITSAPFDGFHCEQCDFLVMKNMLIQTDNTDARNSVKINQSQHIYLEDSDFQGGYAAGVDFVAVQYGHLIGNHIHGAQDWCHWNKGGSAYLVIEGNEFSDCGTGGYTAGQGTGFEFMVSPWLHYEASDIKFSNNVIHDVEGAGIGVNGGYNILMSHNTMYHVGTRDHAVEIVYGLRSCDGDSTACAARLSAGGWGRTITGSDTEPIPDRNVFIYDNVIYNPAGVQAPQIFMIFGPQTPDPSSNIPPPSRTDVDLQIKGNLIWNGGTSVPLGIEDSSQGCQPSNPTCNLTQLTNDNTFNGAEPTLKDPAHQDYRPADGSPLLTVAALDVPNFAGGDRPAAPVEPAGVLTNTTSVDFNGVARSGSDIAGAFASSVSVSPHPAPTPSPTPAPVAPPRLTHPILSPSHVRVGQTVELSVTATSRIKISRVTAVVNGVSTGLRAGKKGSFSARWRARKPVGRQLVKFYAIDARGTRSGISGGTLAVRR